MAVKLSPCHLPPLLSWLEQHLPHSFQIHGQVKSHVRGHFPDVEVFVDSWPHPQTVVARSGHSSTDQDVLVDVFAVNGEKLADLLYDPSVVRWNRRVLFPRMAMGLQPAVQTVAEAMGKTVTLYPERLLTVCPHQLKTVPVPEGMKTRPVSNADIGYISSTWQFTFHGAESYISTCAQHLPSVCLATEHGHHVGHMLGTTCGALGFLYVNPEFRQKGYAKVIISQLARQYLERGEDVHVFIEDKNEVSQALHKSLGFRVVPGCRLVWLSCDPKA